MVDAVRGGLWRRIFGPSTKDRLLDQLDLQSRQAHADRVAFQEALLLTQENSAKGQADVVRLVEAVAQSVVEQSKSFNNYLAMVAPKGEPTVRNMSDAREAQLEREYLREHGDIAALAASGVPVNAPIVDQLAYQDAIASDMASLIRSIESVS